MDLPQTHPSPHHPRPTSMTRKNPPRHDFADRPGLRLVSGHGPTIHYRRRRERPGGRDVRLVPYNALTQPVHVDDNQAWQVFNYADVTRILSDPVTYSSDTVRA